MRGLVVAILVLAAVVLIEGERLNKTLGAGGIHTPTEIQTPILRPLQVEIVQR